MQKAEDAPVFIPLSSASPMVGLCDRTLRRAISNGELPGYKVGRALRVRVDELDRWMQSKAIPNAKTRSRTVSA